MQYLIRGLKFMEKSIENTKQSFEESFKEPTFYNRQTNDNKHLNILLDLSAPKPNDTILDLGTGNGYVAFALAQRYPKCTIIGLDIVADTLSRNNIMAQNQRLANLDFVAYNGVTYPFGNNMFDKVIIRYALHHFTNPIMSLQEISRMLKSRGRIIISDPTPNENDIGGKFVDEYMKIKPDGHIKFYTFSELDQMLIQAGFRFIEKKETTIRFPRKNPHDYAFLLRQDNRCVWEGYDICQTKNEIWITEKVLNLVYEKR